MDKVVPGNSQFQWSIIGSDMPSALGLVYLKWLLFQLQRGGVQKIILHKKCQSLKFSPSCHSPLEQLDDLLRRNVIIKYQISVPRTFLPIIGDFQRLLLQTFANFFFKSDETYIFRNTMQSGKFRQKNYSIKVEPRHCWWKRKYWWK